MNEQVMVYEVKSSANVNADAQKNVLKKKGDNVEFYGVKETHAHAAI